MSIKPDHWIARMARECRMIAPFATGEKRPGVISYGVSSYGYDMRVADEFRYPLYGILDPKRSELATWKTVTTMTDERGVFCQIPPNSFVLARSVEYFRIPRGVLAVCLGKSTYARVSVHPHITPLEPEWKGHVTLEIANNAPLPARVYANEGIAQVLFFESDEPCVVSYLEKSGIYQAQTGVTMARVVSDREGTEQ